MSAWTWLAILALGGVGALARFLADGLIDSFTSTGFPLGTLAINLVGSFALGLLTGISLSANTLLLAGGATLGSFTTFSTWMFESHRLGEDAELAAAAGNLAASLTLGLLAAAGGHAIATNL